MADELLVRLDGSALAALRVLLEREAGRPFQLSGYVDAGLGPVAHLTAEKQNPTEEAR